MTSGPDKANFLQDVVAGLSLNPKRLSSKYFYDETGDSLFREIMKLEAYYPTRCEFEILDRYKASLLDLFALEQPFRLIELGAGDGTKTRLLLEHFVEQGVDFTYIPVDISSNILQVLESRLKNEIPGLKVYPVHAEYRKALRMLDEVNGGRNIVLFLGGNIGNFSRDEARQFLSQLNEALEPNDFLLTGIDLKKDPRIILKAYDDSKGVTARFNLNLLNRINRELNADFVTERFSHYPTYDPVTGATRSFLVSREEQTVTIGEAGKRFTFGKWEPIHTEISLKYSMDEISELARQTGFEVVGNFLDPKGYFTDTVWKVLSR